MIVTKKRNRLGFKRIENLLVIKENKKLVEIFKENSDRIVDCSDDAFQAVVLEADNSLATTPSTSASDIFDSEVQGDFNEEQDMVGYETSDDEFEVVFDDVEV